MEEAEAAAPGYTLFINADLSFKEKVHFYTINYYDNNNFFGASSNFFLGFVTSN